MPAALPFIVFELVLTYLALLTVFCVRAARGRVPSGAASVVLIAVVALLGVFLTEFVSIAWITLLQNHADVTANLFILIPAPVVALMVAIQAVMLARVYRTRPLMLVCVYLGVFAALYALWLDLLFNPPADIARYVLTILIAGSIAFGLVWRFVWRGTAS